MSYEQRPCLCEFAQMLSRPQRSVQTVEQLGFRHSCRVKLLMAVCFLGNISALKPKNHERISVTGSRL